MASNSLPPSGFTKVLIAQSQATSGGSNDSVASPTMVDGVPVAAQLEIQSTEGAFLPPRMTGAEMNALDPVVPGMQVFVTDAATVASGMYIRQSDNTWKIVDTHVSDEIALTISSEDLSSVKQFSIPIFLNGENPEIQSTELTITGGDDLGGIYSTDTVYTGADPSPPPLLANVPVHAIRRDRASGASEGIGTDALGVMTLFAGGNIQAKVINNGDGNNFLKIGGASSLSPVLIKADSALDTDVSIKIEPKGFGQILTNRGAHATPSYSFSLNAGDGMFSPGLGSVAFSANAKRQVLINDRNESDGSNFLVLSGAGAGDAVTISASGSDPSIDLTLISDGGGNINFLSGNALQARISNLGGDGTNYLTIYGTSTTNPVTISAEGLDSDISLQLVPTGNGSVVINTFDGDRVNFGIGIDPGNVNSSSKYSIYLGNGSGPSVGVADTIQIYSDDLSAGNTTLGLWTEGTPVSNTVDTTPTKNIAIKVNGTTYYLMAKTIV